VEAKKPTEERLDVIEQSEQLKRYRSTFPNLILTNFLEFRLYRDGERVQSVLAGRPVVLGSMGSIQKTYDGTLTSLGASLDLAPDPHFSATLGYNRNRVELPGGAFDADIASVRLNAAFSTRVFLSALVQYNQLDGEVSANVRLNVIHRPGSDLFIVFNERRGSDLDLWDLADRSAALKVTYLMRF